MSWQALRASSAQSPGRQAASPGKDLKNKQTNTKQPTN